ncbi:MAG: tetratricopeptide repeat protein [Planctomycetes bacterium]|nr:tetratricopeptide repeat protein [Planctomycetota bacterium]
MRPVALAIAGLVLTTISCGDDPEGPPGGEGVASSIPEPPAPEVADLEFPDVPSGTVTWTGDIARIVFDRCAACHRPESSAPFPLLTYADVKKRGRQLVEVTTARYMPPWMPTPGHGPFEGDRSLSPLQIAQIDQWVADGAPQGDPGDLPDPPKWESGWQLGQPDLVLRMPEAFVVPAEGHDVFRNFVITATTTETRYVRAVELLTGNDRVVHHAIMQIDETTSAQRRDEAEEEPGFGGMGMAESAPPDGHFLGWTPGKTSTTVPEGMPWILKPGSAVLLQLHMLPTGRPEKIQCTIGLHFTPTPPKRRPFMILLRNDRIDVAAGNRDYVIEDSFELPTSVKLFGVYPHAHYLGKNMKVFARLPDGTGKWLLNIDDWDFNWQEEYRFVDPPSLPKGTKLVMRFSYDNSANNPRNPNVPPKRTRFGLSSLDEMGTLAMQVVPDDQSKLALMQRAFSQHEVDRDPSGWMGYNNLGTLLAKKGEFEAAITQFRLGLAQKNVSVLHMNLGGALAQVGRLPEAATHLKHALTANPNNSVAHYNLAEVLTRLGQLPEAARHLKSVVEANPQDGIAHRDLGRLLERLNTPKDAIKHYRAAIAQNDADSESRLRLARILVFLKRETEAILECQEVLARRAGDPQALGTLGTALCRIGNRREGLARLRSAVTNAPGRARLDFMSLLVMTLATSKKCTPEEAAEAVRLAEQAVRASRIPPVLDALGCAYAAAGRYPEAIAAAEEAVSMAERARAKGMAAMIREHVKCFNQSRPYIVPDHR